MRSLTATTATTNHNETNQRANCIVTAGQGAAYFLYSLLYCAMGFPIVAYLFELPEFAAGLAEVLLRSFRSRSDR